MKKKLHTRFPATRIKKIMQTDEDVGKIAMAVPLLVSKALELFLQDLCNHTYDVTISRGAKTVNSVHLKQCVHSFNVFDFLREIVGKVPDLGGSEAEDQPCTKRRKLVEESICNDEEDMKTTQMLEVKHTGSGRGSRGRGRGRGGGRRTGSGLSLKFEDEIEDVYPDHSRSSSPDDDEALAQNNHVKSELKVRNFDLNVGLDEKGESVASMGRRQEERSAWPLFGIKEMKTESCDQQASASEEDYDEESVDED